MVSLSLRSVRDQSPASEATDISSPLLPPLPKARIRQTDPQFNAPPVFMQPGRGLKRPQFKAIPTFLPPPINVTPHKAQALPLPSSRSSAFWKPLETPHPWHNSEDGSYHSSDYETVTPASPRPPVIESSPFSWSPKPTRPTEGADSDEAERTSPVSERPMSPPWGAEDGVMVWPSSQRPSPTPSSVAPPNAESPNAAPQTKGQPEESPRWKRPTRCANKRLIDRHTQHDPCHTPAF